MPPFAAQQFFQKRGHGGIRPEPAIKQSIASSFKRNVVRPVQNFKPIFREPGAVMLLFALSFDAAETANDDHDPTMRVGAGGVELVKRGASRYDFSDPYHIAIELSWKEFALAFAGLELGINVVFALLYLARPGCVANMRKSSRNAPHPTTRKRPRATLRPFAPRTQTFGVSGCRRCLRRVANARKF
jgi:hypothetical protein